VLDDATKHFVSFGHGTRACARQAMAYMLLKIVLAELVRMFEIRVDERETNESSMAVRDSVVSLFFSLTPRFRSSYPRLV
jgi:cytochrome P450